MKNAQQGSAEKQLETVNPESLPHLADKILQKKGEPVGSPVNLEKAMAVVSGLPIVFSLWLTGCS